MLKKPSGMWEAPEVPPTFRSLCIPDDPGELLVTGHLGFSSSFTALCMSRPFQWKKVAGHVQKRSDKIHKVKGSMFNAAKDTLV